MDQECLIGRDLKVDTIEAQIRAFGATEKMSMNHCDSTLNLLALDGGGVRGLSEVLILHEIMKRIQSDLQLPDLPRPCDYFHLIGGTSTGGLIALMLGRLRMTTVETIQAYHEIASTVFCRRNKKLSAKDTFKAKTLETSIKKIVASRHLGERMLDTLDKNKMGKAFVCAMPAKNMAYPRRFRTYHVRENASTNCLIWEAARATTAAPTFFKRVTIGEAGLAQEEFLDGGLRCNNPTAYVLEEAMTVFGRDTKLGCLVSIGTGHSGIVGTASPDAFQRWLPKDLIFRLREIATDCEAEAHRFELQFKDSPDFFFRFNVTHGAGQISLEEWKKLDLIETHTKAYLEDVGVSRSIDVVVKLLCKAGDLRNTSATLQSSCPLPFATTESPVQKEVEQPVQQARPSVTESIQSSMTQNLELSDTKTSARRRPAASRVFTGRRRLLNRLEDVFAKRDRGSHPRREFLMYGMGGAGKTQLSLKFAEENRDRFELVFWVDATNKETLEQSYIRLASERNSVIGTSCSLEAALGWLENLEQEWLLLFDGADDVAACSELWPPGTQGNIIYTSRNHMLQRLPSNQTCKVDQMETEEACDLLLLSARLDDHENHRAIAAAITEKLGCLALAIDQAGAYILSGTCSIWDFLDTFEKKASSLLSNDAYNGASSYNRAVYATWELSYSAISFMTRSDQCSAYQKDGAATALKLLNLFGFLHNDNITHEIFRAAAENPEKTLSFGPNIDPDGVFDSGANLPLDLLKLDGNKRWDAHHFRQGISILKSFALIDEDEVCDTVSMHSLVHTWARNRLSSEDYRRSMLQARSLLAACCTRGMTKKHARILLLHFAATQDENRIRATDFSVMEKASFAFLLYVHGRHNEQQRYLEHNLMKMQNHLGVRWPVTIRTANSLAICYANQSKYQRAMKLAELVVMNSKRVFGPEHDFTLAASRFLGRLHACSGFQNKAREILEQTVETTKRVLGTNHLQTLESIQELSGLYVDPKQSVEMLQEVLSSYKSIYGEKHPQTIRCATALASFYEDQRRYDEAEPLMMASIEELTNTIGKTHPTTLSRYPVLAAIYSGQRRFEKAKAILDFVLETCKETIGENHSTALHCKFVLARVFTRQGHYTKAIKLLIATQQLYEELYGGDHPYTQHCKVAMARAHCGLKQMDKAEDLLQSALEYYGNSVGQQHSFTKSCRHFLAEVSLGRAKSPADGTPGTLLTNGEDSKDSYLEFH